MVRRGFEANQNKVSVADFLWKPRAFGLDVKISLGACNQNAILANHFIIGPKKEMHLMTGLAKPRAIITAQCATSHNGNFHAGRKHFTAHWTTNILPAQPSAFSLFGNASGEYC